MTLGLFGHSDIQMTKAVEFGGITGLWETQVKPMALASPRQVLYHVTHAPSSAVGPRDQLP